MELKECNTCHELLPNDKEHFNMRLVTGGVWGTTAKCKTCMNERARELRTVRIIKEKLQHAAP